MSVVQCIKMANLIIYQSATSCRCLKGFVVICYLLVALSHVAVADSLPSSASDGPEKVLSSEVVALQDQVNLLSKQLTALTMRRREDYQLLENNMKKHILDSAREFSDVDIKTELRNLK